MNGFEFDRNWLESMSAASYEHGGIAVYHKDDGTKSTLACKRLGVEPEEEGFELIATLIEPATPDELENAIRLGLEIKNSTQRK